MAMHYQTDGGCMLIRTIEKFLRTTDMAATKFGRLAAQDPRFVLDLRNGRMPRTQTERRIEQFMARYLEQSPETSLENANVG